MTAQSSTDNAAQAIQQEIDQLRSLQDSIAFHDIEQVSSSIAALVRQKAGSRGIDLVQFTIESISAKNSKEEL